VPDVPSLLPLLPWPVRLRLRWERTVDRAACWLCDHRHVDAAVLLWRACRLW
jgi:hypothetical protein